MVSSIKFYEVNFGCSKLPFMEPKCFRSFQSALFYGKQLKCRLVKDLEAKGFTLKGHDCSFVSESEFQWLLVFEDEYFHLHVYEINVFCHYYILED